jgi:1-deoxy-D-xylulose-5-phosphate synthase
LFDVVIGAAMERDKPAEGGAGPWRARRASRAVWVGGVRLGGGAPVAVEAALPRLASRDRMSMRALRAAVEAVERAGADLVRLDCATPTDIEALRRLAPGCALPLLADIGGGDPALAVMAMEAGARGVWLAPLSQDGAALAEIAALARAHGCMLGLRLGLQGAPVLPAAPSPAIALAQLALRETGRLAELGCTDIVIALRLDDPGATIAAMRALGRSCDWPLALAPGVAGAPGGAAVNAALAIGLPLGQGFGDLIRLPMAADPVTEARGAVQAIRALGLRPRGVSVDAEEGFVRLRPDAQEILVALEDRLAPLSFATVQATLSALPTSDPGGPSVSDDPMPAAGNRQAGLRLRVACGGAAARLAAADLVARAARSVEDRVAAMRARDLHGLAAELAGGTRDPRSRAWIEAAVALFALGRGREGRIVWGSPTGETAWMRLTGRRPAWQMPRGVGPVAAAASPGDILSETALSTALGLALAAQRAGEPGDVVAVVEPGAVVSGAGLAAIRAARAAGARLLIVLLDPDLDETGLPGAVAAQLSRLVSSAPYLAIRDLGKQLVRTLPGPGYELARRAEEFARGIAAGGFMFDELGVYYVGPVAGRRYDQLLPVLRNLRDARRDQPVLLHVAASSGIGARPGGSERGGPRLVTLLERMLAADPQRVVVVTGEAPDAAACAALARRHPGRCVHAVVVAHHGLGLARGLAAGGARPLILLDRRSLWPEAGEALRGWGRLGLTATLLVDLAAGASDLPWLDAPPLDLAVLPGIAVLHAASWDDIEPVLAIADERAEQPVIVAFDGSAPMPATTDGVGTPEGIPGLAPARRLSQGTDIALVAVGRGVAAATGAAARLAALGISACVVDPVVAQPFDPALAHSLGASYRRVVALDDPQRASRVGGALAAALAPTDVVRLRVVTFGRRVVDDLVAAARQRG